MAKVVKVKGSRKRKAHTRSIKQKVGSSYDIDLMYAKKGQNGGYIPNPNLGHSSFNSMDNY